MQSWVLALNIFVSFEAYHLHRPRTLKRSPRHGHLHTESDRDALTGTADPNATGKISEGSTVLGTTTANASGVWSFTPTSLAQGLQTVTASETNPAGLTGYSYLTFHL